MEFKDLTSEEFREYHYPNGSVVRIAEPKGINTEGEGHRIVGCDGFSYYVPAGWILLKFKPKEGEPNFTF